MSELRAIGAQSDDVVRSVAKVCQRIYALNLPRSRQSEVLYALRKALNVATRYRPESGGSLEQIFSATDER